MFSKFIYDLAWTAPNLSYLIVLHSLCTENQFCRARTKKTIEHRTQLNAEFTLILRCEAEKKPEKKLKKKHQSFALLDKQKFSKVNYVYVCENASQYCTWKWKYAKESGEFAKFISPLCPNVFPYFVFLFWLCFFFSESFLESLTQKKTVKIRMNAKKTSMNKQMLYILVHDTRDTQTHINNTSCRGNVRKNIRSKFRFCFIEFDFFLCNFCFRRLRRRGRFSFCSFCVCVCSMHSAQTSTWQWPDSSIGTYYTPNISLRWKKTSFGICWSCINIHMNKDTSMYTEIDKCKRIQREKAEKRLLNGFWMAYNIQRTVLAYFYTTNPMAIRMQ